MTRRDFGTTRRLPSGRWQARFSAPDGGRAAAERTFATRAEAATYLAGVQSDLDRGAYVDPTASSETSGDYATTWLAQRTDLRPRTVELYEGLLNRHLLPHLGTVPLARLAPAVVRRVVEGLRALQIVHRAAHKARTQTLNQLHALIVTAPEPIRGQLRGLGRPQMLSICQGYRPGDRDDLASITKLALRELATRVADLDDQIKRVETRRHRLVRAHAPRMLAIFGLGPDTAATLLVSAGDNPDRLHSEASFAALLGASPIKASSGKTKRKRLNRGGDRQGNSALWHIVITRMSTQPATKAYVERRTTEGLSTSEIIRCLKRYVAREVFNALHQELRTYP